MRCAIHNPVVPLALPRDPPVPSLRIESWTPAPYPVHLGSILVESCFVPTADLPLGSTPHPLVSPRAAAWGSGPCAPTIAPLVRSLPPPLGPFGCPGEWRPPCRPSPSGRHPRPARPQASFQPMIRGRVFEGRCFEWPLFSRQSASRVSLRRVGGGEYRRSCGVLPCACA